MLILAFVAAAASAAPLESATLPLPPELRASASIVSVGKTGEVTTLRRGSGRMVCTADWPDDDLFDARCYDRDFIPYLYRSMQLLKHGVPGDQVDARIQHEIEAGKFDMTMKPTAGYRMSGPITALIDNGTAWTKEISRWQSIHIPLATAESVGLTTKNEPPMPYVMSSGELWAHIMINSPPD